jgi:hypothetical protein
LRGKCRPKTGGPRGLGPMAERRGRDYFGALKVGRLKVRHVLSQKVPRHLLELMSQARAQTLVRNHPPKFSRKQASSATCRSGAVAVDGQRQLPDLKTSVLLPVIPRHSLRPPQNEDRAITPVKVQGLPSDGVLWAHPARTARRECAPGSAARPPPQSSGSDRQHVDLLSPDSLAGWVLALRRER